MSSLSQFNRAERVSDKINEARTTGAFVTMQPADAEMIPFILKNRGYHLYDITKFGPIQKWYIDKISHHTAYFAFNKDIPGIAFVEPSTSSGPASGIPSGYPPSYGRIPMGRGGGHVVSRFNSNLKRQSSSRGHEQGDIRRSILPIRRNVYPKHRRDDISEDAAMYDGYENAY
jgi:hypothetical protein